MSDCPIACSPRSLAAKRGFAYILCLALVLFGSACSREEPADETVYWPELVRFDEVAVRADGFARAGDHDSVRSMRPELLDAGRAVTPATAPSNVADPQQVATNLADLTNLLDGISAEGDDESTASLVLGLHPVIGSLMEAAGMPHVHAHEGPNHGFLHPLFGSGGAQVGTAEIKLHDDAGDLEVWLTRGGHGGEPWRLALDTTLSLSLPDLGQEVTLAVRDSERNEDEYGAATIQDGATAYFVFPGETGADASWLIGADFAAKAELSFDDVTTGSFVLRPHVH